MIQNGLLLDEVYQVAVRPMVKSKIKRPLKKLHRHIFGVDAGDVDAARRLLSLISQAAEDDPVLHTTSNGRGALLGRARFTLALRQRRIELLGDMFAAEPPFDVLVVLYVTEDPEEIITTTKVAELTCLPFTTVLRWLEVLEAEGWIDRASVAGDARKLRLTLRARSRDALDELFS